MRCIIIDDEPNAISILRRYADKLDFLQTVATFRDPVKAVDFLNHEQVDLLFVDINMPELTGLQLLSVLNHQPLVIFTTAYSEYAVESYEYNAVDYLVKPILFERFVKAVNKAAAQLQLQKTSDITTPDQKEILHLKSGTQVHRVSKSDVLFFEKDANYIIVHTKDKKIMLRGNMPDVYRYVSANEFVQVHKSFIVNLAMIDIIEVHQLTVKGNKIPVGHTYREAFMQKMKEQ
jgi:two-component system, LytTR family, response regulator